MRVYLDHNATTPLRAEVRERMLAVWDALGGNASSLHTSGRRARALVDESREEIATALGVLEDEIVFTSGGTESNNLALRGSSQITGRKGALITTAAEHSSILECARALAVEGHPVEVVPVDPRGLPDPEAILAAALRHTGAPGEPLVSVMAGNNETGAAPDLAALGALLRERAPALRLHTDAVQALGRLELDPVTQSYDLASFSAHKVGGPAGVGVLWRRGGTALRPLLHGGGQEGDLRPGTENVAGIAGAACAIRLAVAERPLYSEQSAALVRELWSDLEASIDGLRLVGPPLASARRLPNTLCVLRPGTDGKVLVMRLDLEGLEISAGSACASGSLQPSHVLMAMGWSEEESRAGLRLSVGRDTSRADCEYAGQVLRKVFSASRAT